MDTQTVFSTIYRQAYWGSAEMSRFYSGSGSHQKKLVQPYIEKVSHFLSGLEEPPVVVDLGCGDFNIGRQLSGLCNLYYGCDIVAELIDYNRERFEDANLVFLCLDASQEELPAADVLIVRQVLQHLSNKTIGAILKQFDKYQYVLVTEHIPEGKFTANLDKPSGPDSRLRIGSGVDIIAPPFSFKTESREILCEVTDSQDFPGLIRTTLYGLATKP